MGKYGMSQYCDIIIKVTDDGEPGGSVYRYACVRRGGPCMACMGTPVRGRKKGSGGRLNDTWCIGSHYGFTAVCT